MEARSRTIAIRPAVGEPLRKITKIIDLNGSGFSILTPYHGAKRGFLFKMPVDRSIAEPGEHSFKWSDCIAFTAEDRVKLSYHTDGFVQFSSEGNAKIISGRDPTTGNAKGLGLIAHPLSDPIWSGPSIGVTAWGLGAFNQASDDDKGLLVFEPEDFYYRGCTPADATAWVLHVYVFPANVTPPVKLDRGTFVLDAALEGLNGPWSSVIRLKVIHLRRENIFLGLCVNRGNFPIHSESGWSIQGPGDYSKDRPGHVLMGVYPRPNFPTQDAGSLDRPLTDVG